ncbi:MAG: lamin tail domain-containing protein [Odoribacteraceae bacterium]|jgi:hypothetical protein|nr:lamin tail domain-containing protein [Odoribacteraceae bacterium]
MKKIIALTCILAAGLTACVEDEVYVGPATITDVAHAPNAVTPDDDVVVTATITDLQGITSAKIQYKVGTGTLTAVAMTGTAPAYSGTIPRQADEAEVTFYVEAVNKAGITTKSPERTYTVGAIPTDYTQLVLNEIDGNSKAIEIFNAGAVAIPLEGVTLVKNNDDNPWWTGSAASGSIEPGGYALVIQDNPDAAMSGRSGISPKQNLKFELKAPDGSSLGTFLRGDEGSLSAGISDTAPNSYQRCPNGTGDWKQAPPTNGAANPATGTGIPQS